MIPYFKKYINPIGYITHSIVIWTVVLLAVNRWIAVCLPFKAHRLLTLRKAALQVSYSSAYSLSIAHPVNEN